MALRRFSRNGYIKKKNFRTSVNPVVPIKQKKNVYIKTLFVNAFGKNQIRTCIWSKYNQNSNIIKKKKSNYNQVKISLTKIGIRLKFGQNWNIFKINLENYFSILNQNYFSIFDSVNPYQKSFLIKRQTKIDFVQFKLIELNV